MWRSIVRIAPLAMVGYRWWKRRQHKQTGQSPQSSRRPPTDGDRLP